MRKLVLAMLLCAGCAARGRVMRLDGTTISPVEIDATVERVMRAARVPGVGLAVFSHGVPVYVRAYGVRDQTRGLPLTIDTVMPGASLTKAAFAILVMQLVGAGQIDLDRPIRDYLPRPVAEYPAYADLAGDPRVDRLTARMLLSHTSGFANWRWLEDDRKLAIHFEPGTRFAYSGEGIALLQRVVEAVAQAPLDRLMDARVFGPLGMTRTSMVWQPRFEADHADGHDESGGRLGPQRRTRPDAAGSMQTTLADYARLVAAVMQGRALRPTMRDEMLRPQIRIDSAHEFPTLSDETTAANRSIDLSYGLGWGLYRTPYGRAFFKEGHDDGWRHYAVGFDAGSGLLIMTNSSNGEGIYQALLETVLGNRFTPLDWEGFMPYDEIDRSPLARFPPPGPPGERTRADLRSAAPDAEGSAAAAARRMKPNPVRASVPPPSCEG
jgi:CubicO group peptidase (beta-lactamase class C family)